MLAKVMWSTKVILFIYVVLPITRVLIWSPGSRYQVYVLAWSIVNMECSKTVIDITHRSLETIWYTIHTCTQLQTTLAQNAPCVHDLKVVIMCVRVFSDNVFPHEEIFFFNSFNPKRMLLKVKLSNKIDRSPYSSCFKFWSSFVFSTTPSLRKFVSSWNPQCKQWGQQRFAGYWVLE